MQRFNGTYNVKYAGEFGNGHGVMTLQEGVITGRDYTHATYNGTGNLEGDTLHVIMEMNHSGIPGTFNVMTGQRGKGTLRFEFDLPSDFLQRDRIVAETTVGPLILNVERAG